MSGPHTNDRVPVAPTSRRLEQLVQAIDAGRPADVVGASGGFAGFVLAALRDKRPRPLVVVTPDDDRAAELRAGLDFFEPPQGQLDPVVLFRGLDHTPFSGMSPSRVHVMDRVASLFRVVNGLDVAALVIPARALLDRVMPRSALTDSAWIVSVGDTLDRDGLLSFLAGAGYHGVPAVEDPGSFAVRGGIVDVYTPLYDLPVRIDLWGDEVDSLRFFDPATQQTTDPVSEIVVGPARDILFTDASMRRARNAIHDLADELHIPTSRARAVAEDIQNGILGVGMEELLPAFYDQLETLFDLAPRDALWFVEDPDRCRAILTERWEDVAKRAERARAGGADLAYRAEALYLEADEALARLDRVVAGRLLPFEMVGDGAEAVRWDVVDNADVRREIEAATRAGEDQVLAPLTRRVREWREQGWPVVVCSHTEGGAERIKGLLGHYGLKVARHQGDFHLGLVTALRASDAEVDLFVGDPGQGFRSPDLGLVILDETEILGKKARRRAVRRGAPSEAALASWRDLKEGDYVVHLMHGIGRYVGLTKTAVGNIETDFLVIEYSGHNKLFVPVDKLHLVSRHTPGDSGAPPLDKLGGTGWQRTKSRVKKAVRDIAKQLLKIYAERELRQGYAFSPPGEYFSRFEAAFPYDETPDQHKAIEEVLEDMQRARPMDRLVCGDVGFGKTEVAMRAAAKAVLDGKQVALLVPTVVLAEQHRLSFVRRFDGLPVNIEVLSSSRSSKESKEVLDRVKRGDVDILIGTHRLLSKDVVFRDLGLLVVDEEHRFGVSHKERLKEVRANVDVLTLTATPIPRTLNLALSGLRDISLIQTPPADRLAIRTMVAQPNEEIVAEAIEGELKRGGQVYYVHNRVEDIDKHAELIGRLVPGARVIVGHGQMDRTRLEEVMMRFMRGEANVLVCTTIIESGIDIPNANTMIINRADRFGLAQLYQLRGRVGRSSERAYCYLLIPAPQNLSGDAQQRIAAIQRFTELGSGFQIASYDLDIRGSGDLLGADQSGQIEAVGYDAYIELLQQAIEDLREEGLSGGADEAAPRRELPDPELKVSVEGRIPERWLPDTTLRLRLYKQLAGAKNVDELFAVYHDAIDRYGKAPQPVANLVELMAVKIEARELGLSSVGYSSARMSFGVAEHGVWTPDLLTRLVNGAGGRLRLTPEGQMIRSVSQGEWARGLEPLREILRDLRAFLARARPSDKAPPGAPPHHRPQA